jgi:hypothetical protein
MIGSAGKELLALLVHHRIDRPHALKIPARRADSTLTENVASPFQAEPRHREYLHRYLWQFDFMWNTRKMNDGERTVLAMKSAEGKRLMYQQPQA